MECCRRKKITIEDEHSETTSASVVEFKPFRQTYKIITFAMITGLLYPTPETNRCRLILIAVTIISVAPGSAIILLDLWNSWLRRDILNIIRHTTIVGPFLAVFFKMIIFYMRRVEAYTIIRSIDQDHERYNSLPEAHKAIARRSIASTIYYSEKLWAVFVVIVVQTFPLTAVILNYYNFIFKSEPTKYMIHDTEKPFSEPEDRFESPFFEIMFFYMQYCSLHYTISFVGFDAFFGIIINHLCCKMELYCEALNDALKGSNAETMIAKMAEVIEHQNEVFRIVELLQKAFNVWLGLILIATMTQICNCMYQIIEGHGIDPRYVIFIIGTIVHIYLPCRYATKLKDNALLVATCVYCSGWEHVFDLRVRKMIIFMIARAHHPMDITAFNMIKFDMELFVSILQTSYSMFTLLRP